MISSLSVPFRYFSSNRRFSQTSMPPKKIMIVVVIIMIIIMIIIIIIMIIIILYIYIYIYIERERLVDLKLASEGCMGTTETQPAPHKSDSNQFNNFRLQ